MDDTIKRLEKMEAANTDLKREIVTAVTSAIEGLEGKMNEKFKSVDEKFKTIDENIRNLQTEVKDNGTKIAALSEDVAVLKDRSDRSAIMSNERMPYGQPQDRNMVAGQETSSDPVRSEQDASTRNQEDQEPVTDQEAEPVLA